LWGVVGGLLLLTGDSCRECDLAVESREEFDETCGGLAKGNQKNVRVVGSEEELAEIWGKPAAGGEILPSGIYDGIRVRRKDGKIVSIRSKSSSGGSTIDIEIPDVKKAKKIHIGGD
jgi:hypothetical protein